MDVPQREPCPFCAEPVAVEARICPHCGRSALVELRMDEPVRDGRLRYQAARALAALGGPFTAVGPLQKAMAQPRPRVAGGLTRGQARAGREVLAEQGLHASVEAASAPAGGGLKLAGGIALGASALTLAAWGVMRSATPERPPAVASGARPQPAAAPTAHAARELSRPELARLALASTAALRCGNSVGAGFFVGQGQLLTNAHVLCADGAPLRVVLSDGREVTGTAVRRDEALDLALVSVSGVAAPTLALGDAGAVAVGDRVLMVGSPVGMDFTVHEGMVSAVGRVVLGAAYIQLDAKVNPGNSGGPLLDTRGRAVGIVSLKRMDAEGIALALPINYAWAGASALLDPPGPPSATFEAMVARAQAEDQELAGKFAVADLRPLLSGVALNGQREIMARILRPARSQPYYEEFRFTVWNGSTEVCSMTSAVGEWKQVEPPPEARANPRVQAWLDRHGLSAQFYAGEAPLRLDLCTAEQMRPGVQLELQGADPGAARVVLY